MWLYTDASTLNTLRFHGYDINRQTVAIRSDSKYYLPPQTSIHINSNYVLCG